MCGDEYVVDLRGLEEAAANRCLPKAHCFLSEQMGGVATSAAPGQRIVLCCQSGLRAWWAGRTLSDLGRERIALVAMAHWTGAHGQELRVSGF